MANNFDYSTRDDTAGWLGQSSEIFRPFEANNDNQELLKEINKKLDQILSSMVVPSAYIRNGPEVLDAFKRLQEKDEMKQRWEV